MASVLDEVSGFCFNIDELLKKILGFISDGGTYKIARLVCKGWFTAAGDRVDELSNHLWTLIDKYPHVVWRWPDVQSNPNTTWKLIQRISTECWDWFQISQNPNITWEFVKNNPGYPWSISLIRNPNITINNIKELNKWDWENVLSWMSKNPNLTVWDLEEYKKDMSWNWYNLCHNKNIPLEYSWERIRGHQSLRHYITYHPDITIEFINENMKQYDHFYYDIGLSEHPNMTL